MRYREFAHVAPKPFVDAQQYTGNEGYAYTQIGYCQLAILMSMGMTPRSRVLEIGCGSLSAGHLVIPYLESGHYVGIEPNLWLVRAAVETMTGFGEVVASKEPEFLDRTDFDARALGPFDLILSHSIVSHAAAWQLPQFLENTRAAIADGGRMAFSFIFGADSNDTEWQYPGTSRFSEKTMKEALDKAGWAGEYRPDWRGLLMRAWMSTNYHHWIEARPK